MKKLKNICEGFPSVQHARCLLLISGGVGLTTLKTILMQATWDKVFLSNKRFNHIGNVVSSKSYKSDVVYMCLCIMIVTSMSYIDCPVLCCVL